jgi:hypothetical protein
LLQPQGGDDGDQADGEEVNDDVEQGGDDEETYARPGLAGSTARARTIGPDRARRAPDDRAHARAQLRPCKRRRWIVGAGVEAFDAMLDLSASRQAQDGERMRVEPELAARLQTGAIGQYS